MGLHMYLSFLYLRSSQSYCFCISTFCRKQGHSLETKAVSPSNARLAHHPSFPLKWLYSSIECSNSSFCTGRNYIYLSLPGFFRFEFPSVLYIAHVFCTDASCKASELSSPFKCRVFRVKTKWVLDIHLFFLTCFRDGSSVTIKWWYF